MKPSDQRKYEDHFSPMQAFRDTMRGLCYSGTASTWAVERYFGHIQRRETRGRSPPQWPRAWAGTHVHTMCASARGAIPGDARLSGSMLHFMGAQPFNGCRQSVPPCEGTRMRVVAHSTSSPSSLARGECKPIVTGQAGAIMLL
mmetsp:Transcript_548/g.1822  ORF Transcript_548/g.1822 Transcript_548/m.1822 type:complete len:144 (+) Transcript_548:151-582(+)